MAATKGKMRVAGANEWIFSAWCNTGQTESILSLLGP
jgi:hypothetical protein